jgi:hypothetical protein
MDRPAAPDVALPDTEERMSEPVVKAFRREQCPVCRGIQRSTCLDCCGIGQTYTEAPDHRIIGPEDVAALRNIFHEASLYQCRQEDIDRLAALIGDGNA